VTTYRCGEFRVDVNDRRFVRGEREIALEPRVFAVIAELLARAGSLVTRNDLLDAVWGHRYVTPSTLNRTIALARRAFGDESTEPRFIQTVHGAGYRYVGPADTSSDEQRPARAQFGPPTTMRLPARIDELIGRETSLAALADILARNRR
jgi:DNA-binding winged helix-turn-helix (wHTH) protein